MRICVIGDIHGHIVGTGRVAVDFFVELVEKYQADSFLQVGDFNYYQPMSRQVIAIAGNRDFKHNVAFVRRSPGCKGNLKIIEPGEVVDIGNNGESVTVAGLSGGYDPVDYTDGPYPGDMRSYFTRKDVEKCLDIGKVDIFMVHEAPSGMGFGIDGTWGEEPIRELAEELDYRVMLCGHLHMFQSRTLGEKRIYSLDELAKEFYLLDTGDWSIERVPSIL